MKKVKTLNSSHRRLITNHLKFLQSRLYKITEHDKNYGKFKDFQEIIDTIITYSNDFESFTKKQRSKDEWMYMIPTLTLYACLGFLSGIKNQKIENLVDFKQEQDRFIKSTLNLVGNLSDVLKEYEERQSLEKEFIKLREDAGIRD
tara:strand:+ start:868 stop:1305 length:438 start_codon:yes stop_codon:yes gene_type:complete